MQAICITFILIKVLHLYFIGVIWLHQQRKRSNENE